MKNLPAYARLGPLLASLCLAWPALAQEAAPMDPLPGAGQEQPRPSYRVVIEAPEEIRQLLEANLPIMVQRQNPDMTPSYLARLLAETPDQVRAWLAAEGYYSPEVAVQQDSLADGQLVQVRVEPGPLTRVGQVSLRYQGATETEDPEVRDRLAQARENFPLEEGDVFRQAQWEVAKRTLVTEVQTYAFPTARIAHSQATVNPERQQADLDVVVDTGPAFTFGEVSVSGLKRYPESVVHNLSEIVPGAPYDQEKLVSLQNRLQGSKYFQAVSLEAEPDPERPGVIPVRLTVDERQSREVNLGVGYGTDTGARLRAQYEDNNLADRGWRWNSQVELARQVQRTSTSVILPGKEPGVSHAVGAEYAHLDVQGNEYHSVQLGVSRNKVQGNTSRNLAVNSIFERDRIEGQGPTNNRALFANYTYTRREVDNPIDPRQGFIVQAQIGGAARALGSDASFLRTHTKGALFKPLGERDTLILRGEIGAISGARRDDVPNALLFRAGGVQSVRGYDYLSLGPTINGAVVGGRYLATGSVEYNHWLSEKWGAAVFLDAGDAADSVKALALKKSAGVGARWRTPVGVIHADLSRGLDDPASGVRLDVSLGFTF